MRRLVLLVAVALWPLAPALADDGVAFRISDPRINESSGLVDTGSAMFTVNDSGNEPVLFRLDPVTGRVTSTIRFADRAVDVEALAPGRRPEIVWVGDIGDNTRSRSHIDLYRVDVATGAVDRRELRYPDGAHDAETLLVGPGGRIFVVTKGLSGDVYTAAVGADVMRRVGTAGLFLTDGALMPDGRHVLLRDYGNLHLFTFPDFARVASMRLPRQPQGEGLSVSPDGRVRISSEGVDQPVRDVALSAQIRAGLASARGPGATATPAPAPPPASSTYPRPGAEAGEWPTWTVTALVLAPLVLMLALGAAWARRRSARS